MAGIQHNIAQENKSMPRPNVRSFGDYKTEHDMLADMRKKYDAGMEFNEHNILAGKDDAKFAVGKQWDEQVEQRRRDLRKPVLTFNRLIAFVAQVVGNRLMNETEIRVFPDKSGTKPIAEIREGIIRSIFKNSHADFARDEAAKYQVIGGEGYFNLCIDYTSDDVFEQEIKVNAVTDPYAVVFDPMSIEPSGGDANWAFVGEDMPVEAFKKRWPWAADVSFADEGSWNQRGYWYSQDCVRIVTYWQMVTEGFKTFALYKDGTTHDVSEMEDFEYAPFVEMRSNGEPYVRQVPNRFARMFICSGNAVLEGPYDYPISSIPVYRVPGWEINDGERINRWGIVRFLKDPQRLHNYWRSIVAEQLVAVPRNKFMTTPAAVKGHEKSWREAPTSDDPFLYRNDGEEPPVHIPPPGIDGALVNEAAVATQDMKDISNIHEASLGMPSNEVSKVAIQQRQMVSDVGTYIYIDRRRIADQRCAKNINELIPYIYDTQRTMTIIGRDDKVTLAVINDPSDPNSDVTLGKYGVTVNVGPASETKRTLAAEQMMGFVNAMPQTASVVMDLVAEAQDWPKSGEFARRFKTMLPPGMVPTDEMTPEMQQAQQMQQQMQQMQAELEKAKAEADIKGQQAKAAKDEASARLAEAQAYKAIMDAQSKAADVRGKNEEREAYTEDMDFHRTMKAIDQHNNLATEDRDFDMRERQAYPENQENVNVE